MTFRESATRIHNLARWINSKGNYLITYDISVEVKILKSGVVRTEKNITSITICKEKAGRSNELLARFRVTDARLCTTINDIKDTIKADLFIKNKNKQK